MTSVARVLAAALLTALAATAEAAFAPLGSGARAPGMGDAFTAIADDLYAVYYNPAGLAQLERPQFSAAYSRLYLGLSDGSDLGVSQLVYAHPLKGGRWGTVGGAWDRFSLSGLYTEQMLMASWGRSVKQFQSGNRLVAGLTAKQLSRSFSAGPEASNAKNLLAATGKPDPVLSGANSASAIDADLGLLYLFSRRFQLGVQARHLMQPDVGFAASDKLPMDLRMGLGYRSLWMNLAGELRAKEAPDGSKDKDFVLAAERFFPTLDMGQFGARGSLGFGSRDWRRLTLGLSYRINKVQFDYAFLLPMGSISGTAGTHRMAMTFHFGAPTPEEEITQDLLLQAKRMREGKDPGLGYSYAEALRPRDLDDPDLQDVKLLVDAGEYRKAHRRLAELAASLPPDESLVRLGNRLSLTAYFYSEFKPTDAGWEVALSSSIRAFLYARDREAMLLASYALSKRVEDAKLDNFVQKMEEGVGLKAERLPPGHPRGFTEELLFRVEAANNRGEHEKVLGLLQDILTLEPGNIVALERVGSTYFVLGRYQDALDTWQRAYPLEDDPREKAALEQYINEARAKLGEAGAAPAPRPRVERPRPQPKVQRVDPNDVRRLYQKGVEHYARGEYLQATAMFMRILQIDPENAAAKKALERLKDKR